MKKENTIPVLEKAISLLTFLGNTENGAGQSEIMRQVGISGATCYRAVQTLIKYGWLKKESNGRYDLSYGFLSVGEKLIDNMEYFKLMQKPLDLLSEKSILSTKLSVRKGFSEYVTMLRSESSAPIAVTGKIGAVFPMVEGSVAGALLCKAEKNEIQRLLKIAPDDIFEKNDPDLLCGRIAECKKKGYCFSGKRNRWNIRVISTPICLNSGDIFAAISLLGFPEDFKCRLDLLASELIKTRKECEKILENNFSNKTKFKGKES